MKLRLFIISIFFTASCKTKTIEWNTLDFGAFKIKTPQGWTKFTKQGIDSYVGGLTNGKDSLWFDFGWYSSEINDDESKNHLYGQDTINGHIASIQIPKIDGQGSLRLNIAKVNEKDKFSLGGYDIKGTETILKIFKSVIFKNSDSTINSRLTLSKFKEYPFGSGRTLYYSNCSPCHHQHRNSAGPALTEELLNSRSTEWFYTFFMDKQHLTIDSAYKARQKEFYDLNCIELRGYSKSDIDQIISYLKGR